MFVVTTSQEETLTLPGPSNSPVTLASVPASALPSTFVASEFFAANNQPLEGTIIGGPVTVTLEAGEALIAWGTATLFPAASGKTMTLEILVDGSLGSFSSANNIAA